MGRTKPGIGDKIRKLRAEGVTYKEIESLLGCCRKTIGYHMFPKYREKALKDSKNYKKIQHPFYSKIDKFKHSKQNINQPKPQTSTDRNVLQSKLKTWAKIKTNGETVLTKLDFNVDDILSKFGTNVKCALTGVDIDVNKPRTYQFDHKIPKSKGGDNSLENLQIVTKQANLAKSDLTNEELFDLCELILKNQGYKVTKD